MASSRRDDFHLHQLWLVCQLITLLLSSPPARTFAPAAWLTGYGFFQNTFRVY
ncbi:hypothetical protein [Synechococcus sp. MU1655]|uniref:hypothetical protein n=1 Tax=Synechococcus sp. MU1655 TaxID=2508355 RepID=UPI000B1652AB|nr:hypothetical protein [Synechococcus sp. MU1655]